MTSELFSTLWQSTLASTVAMLWVMLSRPWMRRCFGAGIAYASWLLVPIAMVAVMLPAPVTTVVVGANEMAMAPMHGVAAASANWTSAQMLLLTWFAGALLMAATLAVQQRRFVQRLGPLQTCVDGSQRAATAVGLPLVYGLWRPRIVLPLDFEQRYNRDEQQLILAHERAHLRAGDIHVNALIAWLRCLYWFNPLLHVAAKLVRQDQEMARDQTVVACFPGQRRRYAETMLKTRLAAEAVPFVCHWSGIGPLKERIAMLKYPGPSRHRRIGGIAVLGLSLVLAGIAAWAAQPARMVVSVAPVLPDAPAAPPAPLAPAVPASLAAPEMPATPAVPPAPPAPPVERTFSGRYEHSHMPPPRYPAQAAKDKVSGEVLLRVLVGSDGSTKQVQVEKSRPAGVFDAAVLEAARQWTFAPKISHGKAVEEWIRVPVTFAMDPENDDADDPGRATAPVRM
ncbi:TonB family protein [Pseudoxanthomonas dokdonensis]|uniref:TonB C-terminal domain-containing protein n=1 Tax=Pseudoxanthomonas dokdonensis TaxID=344882 RepID=A0A0R0CJL9_9GAMM|nr:TonB family protein [Pseudoxanthomonas dokdonensis]KRG70063.1 hypothetical protein ABB29_07465 [Pseudoxanthomonas dokdonensis]